MKEGRQKPQKKIKIDLKKLNSKPYSLLLVFGFLSAVLVQKKFGVEEFLGSFLIASVLLLVFYKDVMRYKPHYAEKYRMLLLLGFMVVGTLSIGRLTEYILIGMSAGLEINPAASVFGLPIPAGAMLVMLLFDFHTALIFSFIISLLAGLWQADATIAIYAFVGSLTAAFSVIRCKKRTAIIRGGLYVLVANIIMVTTILLFSGELLSTKMPLSIAFATFSALAVIAIVSLILPLLEYLFKITTDISLLELLDLDQPLMKNLMVSAPGTYHHSIIVGNLVEAVADSVGVNPLLARVSAYYHDIGKMKMPEYFIENQAGGVSKHDRLNPHMSSMILISHVKEGVEMAMQHKLPEVVIDIIEQHHGTSLITYFYEKAKGLPNGTELSEQEYKYPGPKPQSRISALIMMADAVEAASRVLTEPTPARIAALVDKIINHIFLTGQLDECELTLKDIYEVKNRFTYILTGIFHKRVEYPGFDFDEGEKGEGLHKQPAKEDKAKPQADREGLPENPQAAGSSKGRA
jgi:putative nucleotidyltransferase with HDIG domain